MIASSLIGLICGLLLGSRFRVFAVILAQFVAVVVTILFAAFGDLSVGQALLALLGCSLSLQVGYAAMLMVSSRSERPLHVKTSEI